MSDLIARLEEARRMDAQAITEAIATLREYRSQVAGVSEHARLLSKQVIEQDKRIAELERELESRKDLGELLDKLGEHRYQKARGSDEY